MTVTVTVKTRAHGADLVVDGQPMNVPANREQQFQVNPDSPFELKVTEPAEAPVEASPLPLDPNDVPGRAQNDALLDKTEEAAAVDADAAPAVEAEKPRRGFRD